METFASFEIPINIFKEYCTIIKSQNKALIDKFLHAVGLEVYNSQCKVNWETFIFLNCLLRLYSASKEEYIRFFIGVIDPYGIKIVKKKDFHSVINEIFKSQFSIDVQEDKNSLSADVKRRFQEEGFLNENDDLDIKKLEEGFREDRIDIEIFKQALQ